MFISIYTDFLAMNYFTTTDDLFKHDFALRAITNFDTETFAFIRNISSNTVQYLNIFTDRDLVQFY